MKKESHMNRQTALVCLLAMASAMSAAFGGNGAKEDSPTSAPTKDAVVKTEKALDRATDAVFNQTPLHEVLDFVRDFSKVNVHVNSRNLEGEGVDPNTPITLSLRNISVRTLLRQIFAQLGGRRVAWFVDEDGIVTVDTAAAVPLTTTVYDVSWLVDGTERAERKAPASQPATGGGFDTFGAARLAADEGEALMQAIRSTVQPQSWHESGGTASMSLVKTALVVRQTRENQKGIEDLLGKLKEQQVRVGPTPRAQASVSEAKVRVVSDMKDTCFDPQAMTIVAIGSLRSETAGDAAEAAKSLLGLLDRTKNLGTRNAIRLALKDLFVDKSQLDAARAQVEAIVTENDDAIAKKSSAGAKN